MLPRWDGGVHWQRQQHQEAGLASCEQKILLEIEFQFIKELKVIGKSFAIDRMTFLPLQVFPSELSLNPE